MALSFLDDGDIQLMKRVYPVFGKFTDENLFRLVDDPLPERDKAIEFPSRFPEASTVKAVRYPSGLLYYMMGHLLNSLIASFLLSGFLRWNFVIPRRSFSPVRT